MRGIRGRRTRPPGGKQLLRAVLEQIRRQTQRADALKLVDLLKDRGQARLPRIALQLHQQPSRRDLLVPGRRDQALQRNDCRYRQPRGDPDSEPSLEQGPSGADDPVDPGSARRLDLLLPKPRDQIGPQALVVKLDRTQLAGEPFDHPPLVIERRLTEPALGADLATVALHRPARPVAIELRSVDLHLAGDAVRGRRSGPRRHPLESVPPAPGTSAAPRTPAG